MRFVFLATLLLLSSGAGAETRWAYTAEHDPYEDMMSHQAVGGGAQSDGDFAAIAIVCERGVLAAVMLDEAPHGVFGPTPIHYSFDEGAWMTRSWVHANGQATSFDDAAAFAAQVMTHDRLRIRRGEGAVREFSLSDAPPQVQRVLDACAGKKE